MVSRPLNACPLIQLVSTPTRGTATLDKTFTNLKSWYQSLWFYQQSVPQTIILYYSILCIHRTGHRGRNGLRIRTDALLILMAKPWYTSTLKTLTGHLCIIWIIAKPWHSISIRLSFPFWTSAYPLSVVVLLAVTDYRSGYTKRHRC